jgi:uncharacterized membrane protein (DUF485 family)
MATRSPRTANGSPAVEREPAEAGGARTQAIDWTAIEASPEFRELVARRRRFVVIATAVFMPAFLAYLIGMTYVPALLAPKVVGPITLGWLLGVLEIVMAWVITSMYLRRSDREFGPMERRAAERAVEIGEAAQAGRPAEKTGRFVR